MAIFWFCLSWLPIMHCRPWKALLQTELRVHKRKRLLCLACSQSNAIAYQMEKYKNSGLVVILHCLNSFQHKNYVAFSLLHVLLRDNPKINAACFPSFHNGCNAACKVWRSSGRKNRSIQNLFNIDKGTFMDSRESRGKVSEYTLFL